VKWQKNISSLVDYSSRILIQQMHGEKKSSIGLIDNDITPATATAAALSASFCRI